MFMLQAKIRMVLITVLITCFLGLGSFAWFQTHRLSNLLIETNDLKRKIKGMEAAVALTDRLRQDNAKLARDRDDLRKELLNAEDYNQPLSDVVCSVLERLRTGER